VFALLLAVMAGVVAYDRLYRAALEQSVQRGQNTLSLSVSALNGQLQRFDRLPQLLAQQRVIQALMRTPEDPEAVLAANSYLRDTALLLEASDIYVMNRSGTTIAASNFETRISFIGGNFAFRPYFQNALARGEGRFYALGTTSRVRGYYFGAPIYNGSEFGGVMVIKIDLDSLEERWRGSDYEIIVTDPEDIVFMASRAEWTFGAVQPLTDDRLARTQETRRYADRPIRALPIIHAQSPGGAPLWRFPDQDYLVASQYMPSADWTVRVLISTLTARQQAVTRLALAGLVLAFAGLVFVVVWQRRARLRDRLALQAEAQAQLERRVIERTAELAAVNARLADEVQERTQAEERLRATQADLVQAGKLAALGKMSAALSH
jgi:two-component system C4-dicarboxylate transport sensor histidine kinase DctB